MNEPWNLTEPQQHDTYVPGRIRWESGRRGNLLGYVGTQDHWAFQIFRHGPDVQWELMAGLWGIPDEHPCADSPADLKAKAERLLADFVTSLGAIFPEPAENLTEGEA